MKPFYKKPGARKKQRLFFLLFGLAMLSLSIFLILSALKENIVFFLSPSEIETGNIARGERFRLGGLVLDGSLKGEAGEDISFRVTDGRADIEVLYKGLLPDLFAEGQGVVARGHIDAQGFFRAEEILAKHDENYQPPALKKKLEKAKK